MTADQTPRYGRVHFNPGWWPNIVSLLFLATCFSIVFRDPDKPGIPSLIGWLFGVFVIVLNLQVILRIPAIETDEEGITLRTALGWGRVFVKWEDVEGVIIWHDHTSADRSTMIAIATREDFEYNNYGRYRPIRRTRNPYAASKVKRRFRSWSVNTGKTSVQKIVKLVNASGKDISVVEELPHGNIWNHTGPQ